MNIWRIRLASSFCILAIMLAVSWASRAVAATITVTSTADSGAGSLRDAIASANSGDTIMLDVAGTITLTSGPIAIDQNLEISGPGTISGGGTTQVFIVGNGFSVNVDNVTIENGFVGNTNGGGIVNNGTLTITSSTMTNNLSNNGDGGSIFNGGTLTVNNSTIENSCGASVSTEGCGIFNSGTLTVTDSTLSGNVGPSSGAGIYNAGTATVTGSMLSGNDALFGEGGALTTLGCFP